MACHNLSSTLANLFRTVVTLTCSKPFIDLVAVMNDRLIQHQVGTMIRATTEPKGRDQQVPVNTLLAAGHFSMD
eukprot:1426316-Amphidinium_carterae.1